MQTLSKTEGEVLVTATHLASRFEADYSKIIAALAVCEKEKFFENRLAIYHNCQSEIVGTIDYGISFPNLPWHCPVCEKLVNSYDEIAFDLVAVLEQNQRDFLIETLENYLTKADYATSRL